MHAPTTTCPRCAGERRIEIQTERGPQMVNCPSCPSVIWEELQRGEAAYRAICATCGVLTCVGCTTPPATDTRAEQWVAALTTGVQLADAEIAAVLAQPAPTEAKMDFRICPTCGGTGQAGQPGLNGAVVWGPCTDTDCGVQAPPRPTPATLAREAHALLGALADRQIESLHPTRVVRILARAEQRWLRRVAAATAANRTALLVSVAMCCGSLEYATSDELRAARAACKGPAQFGAAQHLGLELASRDRIARAAAAPVRTPATRYVLAAGGKSRTSSGHRRTK